MQRYTCLLVPLLFLASRVDAKCELANSPKDVTYSYKCTFGTIADLQGINHTLHHNDTMSIDIRHMPVGYITESLFSRFAGHLKALFCHDCQLSDVADDAFSGFDSLQFLSLDNNNLTKLNAAWLKNLHSLIGLNLAENKIKDIEDNAFTALETLILESNNLTTIRREWFTNPASVVWLHLDNNEISHFPNYTFSEFTDLRILGLKHNNLTEFKAKWFGDTMGHLERLGIEDNNIRDFEDDLFNKAASLKRLDISHNKFNCSGIRKIISRVSSLELLFNANNSCSECKKKLLDSAEINEVDLKKIICQNYVLKISKTS